MSIPHLQKISSEPASSTLDPLGRPQANSSISNVGASNPATPGLHIPGAFPDPFPKSDVQQDIQYVKDTAVNALQTAKEYMSTGVEDVKRLMENTGDTVGGYLPQTVNAYLPHHTTVDNPLASVPKSQDVLPLTASLKEGETQHPETSQNGEHPVSSGGVGDLPVPPNEFGVAIPPDERISSQEKNTLNSQTLHSETAMAEDRSQHLSNDASTLMTENALPKEKKVPHLPEEKKSVGANRDATVLPIDSNENTTASSQYSSHPTIPNTTARTYPFASDGFKFKGVPLSKGFQKELIDQEQSSSSPSLTSEDLIEERRNLEQRQSDVATTGHGGEAPAAGVNTGHDSYGSHAASETIRKKLGFMNKLKEEMKGIPVKLHIKKEKDFVGVA